MLLPFLTFEQHKWEIINESYGTLKLEDFKIEWKLIKSSSEPSRRSIYFKPEYKIFKNEIEMASNDVNFFFFLKKTIEKIDQYDLNWYK
jgi:hypothetical protein